MSVVGPRPNTFSNGVELYTSKEMLLLSVKPGITDPASIVFSDEAYLLRDAQDPDLKYNQLIRPWKSRLSLWYLKNIKFGNDVKLCVITFLSIFNRQLALKILSKMISKSGDNDLAIIALRDKNLFHINPPE